MISTMIIFTKEIADSLTKAYQHNKLFKLSTLEPSQITSNKYRIEVYSHALKRSIICTDFEDFYITLNMLENLEY